MLKNEGLLNNSCEYDFLFGRRKRKIHGDVQTTIFDITFFEKQLLSDFIAGHWSTWTATSQGERTGGRATEDLRSPDSKWDSTQTAFSQVPWLLCQVSILIFLGGGGGDTVF